LTGAGMPADKKQVKTDDNNLRLLYWNIQNGMWSGQDDNYDKFVEFVKEKNPDVCVWCEASSIYYTGSYDKMPVDDKYLPDNWDDLAKRYGHKYWYKGGHRDNYPQVITSRYPIENVKRIVGAMPDSVVTHGAGWATINKNGHNINIVTLHTWPQRFKFGVNDKEQRAASMAANEGDHYRRMEIEYICRHTIDTHQNADKELWMMMGDFNSKSRVDNHYYKYTPDTTAFLCQDYVINNTPYVDVIAKRNPGKFISSCGSPIRIDYVYCTKPLYDRVKHAEIIHDSYTTPVRDERVKSFYNPSDHCPILIDFDLSK
ncbi:MAG: endonuclease, partial [Muribaculaceae bacterium]|nr:endonuclease [Muribaculaceae bacterium]